MTRGLALLLLLLVPVVPWSQRQIDRRAGAFRPQEEVLYLWSGRQVKRLFPGFEALAADIYWLRTVQYFGGQRLFASGKRFDLLRPLIEITTTLDPRLEIAYRYGAIFLSEAAPFGAGRPREGVEVLAEGVRNLPDSWRLRQDLGFFHYIYLKDPQRAAAILLEAAEIPGAAFWLRTMAADLLAKGGDRADVAPDVDADVRAGGGGDHPGEREAPAPDPRLARRGGPPRRSGGRVREAPRAPPGPARGAARSGAVGRAAGRRGRDTVRL